MSYNQLEVKVKGKFTSGSSSKTTSKVTTTTVKKREKKVYSLAGQKYDPPEEVRNILVFIFNLLFTELVRFSRNRYFVPYSFVSVCLDSANP